RGAAAAGARDVRVLARRRLVGPHPRAEADGSPLPPLGALRGSGPADAPGGLGFRSVRRLALVLALVALLLAACGNPNQRLDQDKIKSAYETFFSSKSSVSDRVAVLQDGTRFKGLVTVFANNPLAQNVSATVGTVTLQGKNNAKVTYTVKLGGTKLPQQTGT